MWEHFTTKTHIFNRWIWSALAIIISMENTQNDQNNIQIESQPKKKKDLPIGSAIVLAAVIIGGAMLLKDIKPAEKNAETNTGSSTSLGIKLEKDEHIRGDKNAPVLLVEYSDIDCPFCKKFHPTVKQALEEYDGQIAWVYRHFPLTSLHPEAKDKAIATECVAKYSGEDAFWTYLDYLVSNEIPASDLWQTAQNLGYTDARIETCIDTKETLPLVEADIKLAGEAGAKGTPHSVVFNSKTGKATLVSGAYPIEELKNAIDGVLN